MADEFTPNYGLFKPVPTDSMADVKKNLTDSFEKLVTRADPTVIANGGALPQVGDYEIGDRVIRMKAVADSFDHTSSFILVCKDATWGWHWRPVQNILSPWIVLPAGVIDNVNWSLNATYPPAIALDSRGFVHWRGAITFNASIANMTSFFPFKTLPVGLRPNSDFYHTVPVDPINSGTGLTGYKGGRVKMEPDGTCRYMFFNTSGTTVRNAWLTGLEYWSSYTFASAG
jgi:hypothetical protein